MVPSDSRRMPGKMALVAGVMIALLPSAVKVALYRLVYRYDVGRNVRIGFSPLVGVRRCRIGDGVRIGHLNLFVQVEDLDIDAHSKIGFLNMFRGGRIRLGAYTSVFRMNFINSIPEPDAENVTNAVLDVGPGAVITSGHRLDFTDRITIGASTVIGGRGSAFWTHSRHRTRPIAIGNHCYLGSGVQVAPGVEVADFCIVSLGAVLTGQFTEPRALIVGNPGRVERRLRSGELLLVARRTRDDLPDELAQASLPEDMRVVARGRPRTSGAEP